MKREEHLVYCKKCVHRKMDFDTGILCEITNKIADFENICPNYEIDEVIKEKENTIVNQIKPNKKYADFAKILISIILVLDVISMLSSYMQLNLLNAFQEGQTVTDSQISSNDSREQIIGVLYAVFYITSAITFLNWFKRAYYNLNVRAGSQYTNSQSLYAWFIPYVNLYRPYQIMKEMWETTSQQVINKSNNKNKKNNSLIISAWWFLWVFSSFIGRYILRNLFKENTINDLINTTIADILAGLIGVALAIITYIMIDKYSQKEEELINLEKNLS
ncbi:DUF4328 domain-containing protein [Flavobacteriaceae bacterium]|nr:DUF4328 domain-containing protein [Flavobacteriaceae bacterium]